jgi:hypothetical protein
MDTVILLWHDCKKVVRWKDDWYSKVHSVQISSQRYLFMLNKLGAEMPALDVYEGSVEDENNGTANWGNFEQFNSIVLKLEKHVASIGEKFLLPNIDITIDDNKLRHSSHKFRDEGLQLIIGYKYCTSMLFQTLARHYSLWGQRALSML